MLATTETECMLAKVLWFVEVEESAKYSLSDSKLFESVSRVSTFKRQQQQGGVVRQPVVNPAKAVPRMCNNCGTSHVEFRSRGRCPAYNTKCHFCERLGHYKVKCGAYRKQNSVTGDKPKEVTKDKLFGRT